MCPVLCQMFRAALAASIPLAHGLKGCSLALLVLIPKEKYFKEHLITVQGAVLLKMPMELMYMRTWMGEPCLCRDQAPLQGDTGLAFANLRLGRVFGHGAMAALGLGSSLGSQGVL